MFELIIGIIILVLVVAVIYAIIRASTYVVGGILLVGAVVGGFIALKNYILSFYSNVGSTRKRQREEFESFE